MQEVTRRLDGLIDGIKENQMPYMDGKTPADVLIVRLSLLKPALSFLLTLCRGCAWSYPPLFCEALDRPGD